MIQENEIRSKLLAVEAGKLPLWDFYDWIEAASINMHRDSSVESKKLVGKVKMSFAEYDHRAISESELLEQLVSLILPVPEVMAYRPNVARFNVSQMRWASGSSQSVGWSPSIAALQSV